MGRGLTEQVGLVGGAEAEGGNGLLVGADDPAAEAGTHVQQPDQAPQACSCQHAPALLVACLCDHRQGRPGHREELLGRGGTRSSQQGAELPVCTRAPRQPGAPQPRIKGKGYLVSRWQVRPLTPALLPPEPGLAHRPAGAGPWRSPRRATCTCAAQCPSGSRSHTQPPRHTWPPSGMWPLRALLGGVGLVKTSPMKSPLQLPPLTLPTPFKLCPSRFLHPPGQLPLGGTPRRLALPAHQGCTLVPGRLEGASPELGLQVPGAVVLAVALQEVQGLQLWGQRGVTAAPALAPATRPDTLLAHLAAIRAHRAALCLGQWRGVLPLAGREAEWDVTWPFQGHWPGLWRWWGKLRPW